MPSSASAGAKRPDRPIPYTRCASGSRIPPLSSCRAANAPFYPVRLDFPKLPRGDSRRRDPPRRFRYNRHSSCRADELDPINTQAGADSGTRRAPRVRLVRQRRFSGVLARRHRRDDGGQYRARHQLLGDVSDSSIRPRSAGFAVISHWLPYLLLAGFSGALADRFDIRRLIQVGMLMFIGVSVRWGLMFLTDSATLWIAMLLLVVHGLAGSSGFPPRRC